MLEPEGEAVDAPKEPFDDAELDHAAHVDRVGIDRVEIHPRSDGETGGEARVELEERREGEWGDVACDERVGLSW